MKNIFSFPFQSNTNSLDGLLNKISSYNPKADIELIKKAYFFSENLHKDQKRDSGEPFIKHPLEVANILADMKLDSKTIATALLHDTIEDTKATKEQIESEFGPEIGSLVEGLTKISKISFRTSEEKQAENFRKMVLAMARDLRVILIKLADRLHNMRTLGYISEEKQQIIAQETLDIYSPLANRLGLSFLKREMEDLAFRYTKPEAYYKLVEYINKKLSEREKYINDVKNMIESTLKEHDFPHAEVYGRPKHLYSIHRKMEKRNLSYDQVYDVTGFRVIVKNVEECYSILGLIHSLWTPVPGRFKDYIAIPKANFYQSLHTTVIGPQGERIEIQIRTQEMHETAEKGIAAHWAYKEGITPKEQEKELEKFRWLTRLIESNKDLSDPNEFLESVKLDLFSEDVYVFTPKGKVLEFPQGSTPLDFAYSIHTDLGHRCIGAKVNNRMVALKYKLKSGDTVEILTSPNQQPNKDWLRIVKTSRAKTKIRSFLKKQEYEQSLSMGQALLEKELSRVHLKLKKFIDDGSMQKVAESMSYKNINDFFSAIGYGKISVSKVITRFIPKLEKPEPQLSAIQKIFQIAKEKIGTEHTVKVKGAEDLLVRFAKCCNPVPGDAVIGFVTRGRGISVHSKNCPKIFESDPHRLVEIEWDLSKQLPRNVKIRIVCEDKQGLLADLTEVIKKQKANITRAQVRTTKDQKAVCVFTLTINNITHLKQTISMLEGIPGVISVQRLQKGAF